MMLFSEELSPDDPPELPSLRVAGSTSVMVGTTVEEVRVARKVEPSLMVVKVVMISRVAEVSMVVRSVGDEDEEVSCSVSEVVSSSEVGVNVEVEVTVDVDGGCVIVEVVRVVEEVVSSSIDDVVEEEVELLSSCRFMSAIASSRGSAMTNATTTRRRSAYN
jgi:hypothetical protein